MNETPTLPTAPQSTVLVATDADHVHDEVAAALSGDHQVVRVHAGAEVLAAVNTHQPVLVVLDLQIGNMGGMATCLDLRLEQRADRIPAQRIVMLLDRDERPEQVSAEELKDQLEGEFQEISGGALIGFEPQASSFGRGGGRGGRSRAAGAVPPSDSPWAASAGQPGSAEGAGHSGA